ncbi:hypothetical protein QTJ16_004200 [Diplocarpon rosae]|uniref:Uncharacterized protein n=1 Tax=Diplocarpon rosae TaxID=946125 RepID=A0AAD9T0E1_9HELO|nr:hypothetical protein QTJ16_004200 [Diplocarpon rosae]
MITHKPTPTPPPVPPGPELSCEAQSLLHKVAADPIAFLQYLGTLEAEHQRLAEAVNTFSISNTELRGIIERTHANFVSGSASPSPQQRKETEQMVKKVAELENLNRNLRNQEEIHNLIRCQNRLLLIERDHHAEMVRTHADIAEENHVRMTHQSYGLAQHIVRLRNENCLLANGLEASKEIYRIELEIQKKEQSIKMMDLNSLYSDLKAEVLESLQKMEQKKLPLSPELDNSDGAENEDRHVVEPMTCKAQDNESDRDFPLKGAASQYDAYVFQLQLRLLALENKNGELKEELHRTERASTELSIAESRIHHIAEEADKLALSFRKMSAETLGNFNERYRRAIDKAQRNFGKLQVAMNDGVKGTEDELVQHRFMAFSKHVREFGQAPLVQMDLELNEILCQTSRQFDTMQQNLDSAAESLLQDYFSDEDEGLETIRLKLSSYHKSTMLRYLDQYSEDTLVESTTSDSDSTDTSSMGRRLAPALEIDSTSGCGSSECGYAVHIEDVNKVADEDKTAEEIHREAAEAEMKWWEQMFSGSGLGGFEDATEIKSGAVEEIRRAGIGGLEGQYGGAWR